MTDQQPTPLDGPLSPEEAEECRRALQAGVPYSLPPRSEVRLAFELLQAALAVRMSSAQSERIDT